MSNLCYGNSLVQALLACDAVKSGMARDNPAERAAAELLKIFNELDTSVNTPLSIEPLTQEVMAWGDVGQQQDCMDMWSRLFQKLPLHVQSLFVGLETYKMTCMVCGKENERSEQFNTLQLPIRDRAVKFSEALKALQESQTPADYTCDSCSQKGTTTQERNLDLTSNKYLFLKLPLFLPRPDGQGMIRSNNRQISDFAASGETKLFGWKYRTIAAIEHRGDKCDGGHYMCWRRSKNNGQKGWAVLDDMKEPKRVRPFAGHLKNIAILLMERV